MTNIFYVEVPLNVDVKKLLLFYAYYNRYFEQKWIEKKGWSRKKKPRYLSMQITTGSLCKKLLKIPVSRSRTGRHFAVKVEVAEHQKWH